MHPRAVRLLGPQHPNRALDHVAERVGDERVPLEDRHSSSVNSTFVRAGIPPARK